MKVSTKVIWGMIMLLLLVPVGVFAQKGEEPIIPLYTGSEVWSDDLFGYEELPFVLDESTILVEEGYLRRIFCQAPAGRSPLEIVRNYEKVIKDGGGKILFVTRKPQEIVIDETPFEDVFRENRIEPTGVFKGSQRAFPGNITEYLVANLSTPEKDIYIIVGTGRGEAGPDASTTFFELVFMETEAMEMDMITAISIADSLKAQGRIAVYDLFFDTGKSEVKPESAPALQAIADYLNTNKDQKVFVVGHTDNIGDFDSNLDLSKKRADAVVAKLITDYNVNAEQLEAFGVGTLAPVANNATEEGRAKNRRVEIVAQ